MSKRIICPTMFNLPKLREKITLFFNLRHFHLFHELVEGTKVKGFGPSRRFHWESNGIRCTALGGMIGAPLAILTLENAVAAGGKYFNSFGSAGWISSNECKFGELIVPKIGVDETGISEDYEASTVLSVFDCCPGIAVCEKIVSVNSFYRLTIEKVTKYRAEKIELIDMESVPLNHVISYLGGRYLPLFVISDKVGEKFVWQDGSKDKSFHQGVEKGLKLLV